MTAKQERLYNQVIDHILEEPKRINMCDWVIHKHLIDKRRLPECGTVACFGGWTVALDKKWDYTQLIANRRFISDIARQALGLTYSQSLPLFGFWPAVWLEKLTKHKAGTKGYAEVVANFARHYLEQIKKENAA